MADCAMGMSSSLPAQPLNFFSVPSVFSVVNLVVSLSSRFGHDVAAEDRARLRRGLAEHFIPLDE